jgi:hypothetical protein
MTWPAGQLSHLACSVGLIFGPGAERYFIWAITADWHTPTRRDQLEKGMPHCVRNFPITGKKQTLGPTLRKSICFFSSSLLILNFNFLLIE